KALQDYNKAIELDPYEAPEYGYRAILYYQMNDFEKALADLNEAIRLNNREGGYYINRGLVRYQMNNLRGAMSDYDQVIDMNSQNLIARFNRGLLRFQVGDNNRAIEDFDVVLKLEPENYMAYYNRALLRFETGNFVGSISDYDKVLTKYPKFLPGYFSRSEAKRKIHDKVGADKDYWTAVTMEQQERERRKNEKLQAQNGQTTDEDKGKNQKKEDKIREQSDENIEKFNRLVVYDKEEERKRKYQSEIRGKVQNRNVKVNIEPMFILTYYEKGSEVRDLARYNKTVEALNNRQFLEKRLLLTNHEAALTSQQIQERFKSINDYSSRIAKNSNDVDAFFGRAIDYMLVQDFNSAIEDFTKVIELDSNYLPAYFNRAAVRYKRLIYNRSKNRTQDNTLDNSTTFNLSKNQNAISSKRTMSPQIKNENETYEHELIVRDYGRVITINPDFVYAYFNRANLFCAEHDFRAAVTDYNEAIRHERDFGEAYFNRGLARLSMGDSDRGISDLSKAGELGIINAYSIIKRMSSK
ncbi:MAG: tetratricopeptide repeat protein, partial [Massilibacteroides sp.]|nr:tetratricopeptide repeat protein [Massilibacteroides sp.]